LEFLDPKSGKIIVDGTLGGGGHTEAICRCGAQVVAFDRDVEALNRTELRLKSLFDNNPFPIRFAHANYRYFGEALDMLEIDKVDGFLLDLGLSSDQLADANRGFSFDSDGELDMRFDTSEPMAAHVWLELLDESSIANIIYQLSGERHSRKIARKIVEAREKDHQPIRTARQLAELVKRCVPTSRKNPIHPATRTFQALRIHVNDELGALYSVLEQLPKRIKPGGIAAVISFHSLEDRIVKHFFRENPGWKILTPKPITATEEEITQNPRARSAKLRAAVRLT
jgi:16S rRNA (cytosine1402-N4)-methyltransferase